MTPSLEEIKTTERQATETRVSAENEIRTAQNEALEALEKYIEAMRVRIENPNGKADATFWRNTLDTKVTALDAVEAKFRLPG